MTRDGLEATRRRPREGRATSAAKYRCGALREAIDFLGAGLGALSDLSLEGSGNIALSRDEVTAAIRRLDALRNLTAEQHGFSDEMTAPEIVSRLPR